VRDAPERRHPLAGLEHVAGRNGPDAHAVGREAGPPVVEDRGHAPQAAALAQRLEPLEDRRDRYAEPLGGGRVGFGDHRHRALRGANRGDVLLAERDRLELHRLGGLAGGAQRLGPALHLEVHADLEQAQRRELADRLRAGPLGDDVERSVQAQARVGLDRDREPEVEVVVAQVVVRDARVRVDELGGTVRVGGIDLRGDQHRGVAERARVEDRRDLADDPLVEQPADALQDLVLGQPSEPRDGRERARVEREPPLHEVEQLLVGLVERHRGAARARPDLGDRRLRAQIHPATSLAW
jgi:hypothetical protein